MKKGRSSNNQSNKAKILSSLHKGTAFDLIGGKLLTITPKQVKAQFVLNDVSRQAFGLLHGGIYAYVAESMASLGAWMSVDQEKNICVGIEVSASHLKAVSTKGAKIDALASCIKPGKNLQVWSIQFSDKQQDLVSIARCSVYIKAK